MADSKRTVARFQTLLAQQQASDLDGRISAAIKALRTEAKGVTAAVVDNPARASTWVAERKQMRGSYFDRGLHLFSKSGRLATIQPPAGEDTMPSTFLAGVKVAIQQNDAVVSPPFPAGTIPGELLVAITVPIEDARGGIIGALAGYTSLGQSHLFGAISNAAIGTTGQLFLLSSDGRLLAHTDGALMAAGQEQPFPSPVLETAAKGQLEPVEADDHTHSPSLFAFSRVQSTGWVLGLSQRTTEAYAGITSQERFGWGFSIICFMLFGITLHAMSTALAKPLVRLTNHIRKLDVTQRGKLNPIAGISGATEIVQLSESFNAMVLRINENMLQVDLAATVFENASEGIIVTDAALKIVSVNKAFVLTTGYSEEEVAGQTPRVLSSGMHDQDFYARMWESIKAHGAWRGEVWNRRKDGSVFPELLHINALSKGSTITHYVGIFTDISDIKAHETKLHDIATTDALTGLPNRHLLRDRLDTAFGQAQRGVGVLMVAFVDLDGFKKVNDQMGHEYGDELLRQVARRFMEHMRAGDTVARLGGDEFVLLLTSEKDADAALAILEKVRHAIALPYRINNRLVRVSASIGYTQYPEDKANAEALLRHADQAMYQAKQEGRNRIHRFDIALDQAVQSRNSQATALRSAIKENTLSLFFQPKVDLKTWNVVGFEALLRWHHPTRGLIAPPQFLDTFEKDDLILEIGDWVLDAALAQMAKWRRDSGQEIPVSVNLAAMHITQNNFVERLKRRLDEFSFEGVSSKLLEIEILETDTFQDALHVQHVLNKCQSFGVRFSLDDFGTGYSSLSYLKNIPAGTIKIDRAFVREMLHNNGDMAIVKGVLSIAGVFNRYVIAEGVESEAIALTLRDMGCDAIQGYWVSKPMPAEEVLHWVEHWEGSISPAVRDRKAA